jgi:hypothetical protein
MKILLFSCLLILRMPCPLARGCSGGLLCTFSTVQSWVQIVSQNSENLLILLLPDSTRDQDFKCLTRNSIKVSTFILSLLDESIHCPVLYVHIVPYLLSDYMLIS